MAELWFIRHFRTPWNAEGRLQGQRDIALDNPLGESDMATLADNRRVLAGRQFTRVLTSPLERARQTAALHGFPDAEQDMGLAEIDFGPWEGRTWGELEAAHPGAWQSAPQTLALGETFDAFSVRIWQVRERVLAEQGPVLAFGHGAWLGGLQRLLEEGSLDTGLPRQALGNGVLVRLNLMADRQARKG